MAASQLIKFSTATSTLQPKNIVKTSAIFFDLDNTLIPTRKGDSKACRKLANELERSHGFNQDEAIKATTNFLQSFRRCPDNPQTSLDSWRSYLWREALPDRHKKIADKIYNKWLELRYRYLALPQDYIHMLQQFRLAGYLLALITNGPSKAQWEKVNKLHVSQYFDCVLVSSDLPWEKPHPNIFYAACNYLCVKPNECVMVGDKLETDIKGGKAANLGMTVWIPLNPDEKIICRDLPDDSRPDIVVDNLLEMFKNFPVNGNRNNINDHQRYSASGSGSSSISSSSSTSKFCHNMRRNNSQAGIVAWSMQQQQQYRPYAGRYRRGASLPDIDCSSENSSDSVFC